jgi:hypothetical protein
MDLLSYINYSCVVIFILYIISVNYFTKTEKNTLENRPDVSPFTFFKKNEESISIEEAINLINKKDKS